MNKPVPEGPKRPDPFAAALEEGDIGSPSEFDADFRPKQRDRHREAPRKEEVSQLAQERDFVSRSGPTFDTSKDEDTRRRGRPPTGRDKQLSMKVDTEARDLLDEVHEHHRFTVPQGEIVKRGLLLYAAKIGLRDSADV